MKSIAHPDAEGNAPECRRSERSAADKVLMDMPAMGYIAMKHSADAEDDEAVIVEGGAA